MKCSQAQRKYLRLFGFSILSLEVNLKFSGHMSTHRDRKQLLLARSQHSNEKKHGSVLDRLSLADLHRVQGRASLQKD